MGVIFICLFVCLQERRRQLLNYFEAYLEGWLPTTLRSAVLVSPQNTPSPLGYKQHRFHLSRFMGSISAFTFLFFPTYLLFTDENVFSTDGADKHRRHITQQIAFNRLKVDTCETPFCFCTFDYAQIKKGTLWSSCLSAPLSACSFCSTTASI